MAFECLLLSFHGSFTFQTPYACCESPFTAGGDIIFIVSGLFSLVGVASTRALYFDSSTFTLVWGSITV